MKLRHSNAYAAIMVLVIVAILFIGMYAVMEPFARIFSQFADAKNSTTYPDNATCTTANKHWYGNACYDVDERAHGIMFKIRRVWLIAPIIFIAGLIFWYFTVSTRKDPYFFQQGGQPPGGGFQ